MKSSSFWIVTFLIIIGAIGGLFLLAGGFSAVNDSPAILLPSAVNEQDHTRGPQDADVVLVEYSDFQCPACSAVYPEIKRINEELGDKVKTVFRHFPLSSIHPLAQLAAQAVEAAHLQGKFWEMHDILYEQQAVWTEFSEDEALAKFTEFAGQLGMDVDKFKQDINSNAVIQAVNSDAQEAVGAGFSGTPTIFINGKLLRLRTVSDVRIAVDRALSELQNKKQ